MNKKNYDNKKWKEWKEKVRNKFPSLVVDFYKKTNYRENEKLLGIVIQDISNHLYSLVDSSGKRISDDGDKIAYRIILEVNVEAIFKFVYSN